MPLGEGRKACRKRVILKEAVARGKQISSKGLEDPSGISFEEDDLDDALSMSGDGAKTTLLRQTSAKRRRVLERCSGLAQDGTSTVTGGLSFLEQSSVQDKTGAMYAAEIQDFRNWAAPLQVDKASSQEVEDTVVR